MMRLNYAQISAAIAEGIFSAEYAHYLRNERRRRRLAPLLFLLGLTLTGLAIAAGFWLWSTPMEPGTLLHPALMTPRR